MRRRVLVFPFVALAAVLGLAAGFGLSLVLDMGSVRIKESPFGLDSARKMPKGRDFDGAKEIKRWSASDRDAYRDALKAFASGHATQAAAGLSALRKAHPEYPLPHALAALALIEAAGRQAADLSAAQAAADAALSADSGHPFALYAAAYTAGRFWIEYLRIDDAHHILGLRLNDWTSLLVFTAALAYVVLSARRDDAGEPKSPVRIATTATARKQPTSTPPPTAE